ncbi:pseudouridylate synthase [Isoalcanivorax pacificus W11-5]|uniref:tRNA pseudouridine synthase B n=1 Tax=Isoalcanivorax pacificus W11-5 TaxID=391936 RepID=A0A0B4XT68_9GAMM|nr:tRNA pseudouridine(55) synthase TruB [Isoalcanivorax pacificus]AJD49708.1 pseudouridylate synthase [Isoalcanivorax pacificus W11-5]
MAKRRQRGRDINGILLLNKPAGITSNGALQTVKRLFAAAKAGHTGSLDPLATGMLPICFGEATKFSQFLLDADKSYRVTARLGVTTETGDADGDVVETRPVTATPDEIEAALMRFLGPIEQIPSMYSAIKHEGQPLYKLARQGITVERKPRQVTIRRLALLSVDGDDVSFEVDCTKGTYVRSLVEDLGAALGCGGHVTVLHRLSAGPYPASEMLTLDELGALKDEGGFEAIDKKLLPLYTAVADWPRVELGQDASYYLLKGQSVMATHRPKDGWVTLYRAGTDDFLGVGEVQEDGMIAPRRLVATH